MRISKGIFKQISKVNDTFYSEKIELEKMHYFASESHENCIKL